MSTSEPLSEAKQKVLERWLRGERRRPQQIRPRPPGIPRRASIAQERMLVATEKVPSVPFRNQSALIRMEGPLDTLALHQSLTEIWRRHENLRTIFPYVAGTRTPVIVDAGDFPLDIISLAHLPVDARKMEALRFYTEALKEPLDLSAGPLLKVALLELSDQEHMLHILIDHLLFDGWSSGVFWRELLTLYEAFSQARPSPLPELAIQYADYDAWKREQLTGEYLQRLSGYWTKRLTGKLPILELPTDYSRQTPQPYAIGVVPFDLGAELSHAVRTFAARRNASTFMVLLTAFQATLARYTGATDVSVVSPVANRTRPELYDLIGCFTNHLVFRCDFRDDPTFEELLSRARQACVEATAHQDMPVDWLQRELAAEAGREWEWPLRLALVLQNYPVPSLKARDLRMHVTAVDFGTPLYDMTVLLVDGAETLAGPIKYNATLFKPASILEILKRFATLLHGGVANPSARVSGLPFVTL